MKRFVLPVLAALIIGSIGVASLLAVEALKLADVPQQLREKNWSGPGGVRDGSCTHASVVVALRWIGKHETADWWRKTYGGAENIHGLMEKLNAAEIPYAFTTSGDIAFLEWAARNRFPTILFHAPVQFHCVNLVDLADTELIILDNRWPNRYDRYPRNQSLAKWQKLGPTEIDQNSSGWALVIIGTPPPPWPAK